MSRDAQKPNIINVSMRNSVRYYNNLCRAFLKQNEIIEVHGLGSAITGVA